MVYIYFIHFLLSTIFNKIIFHFSFLAISLTYVTCYFYSHNDEINVQQTKDYIRVSTFPEKKKKLWLQKKIKIKNNVFVVQLCNQPQETSFIHCQRIEHVQRYSINRNKCIVFFQSRQYYYMYNINTTEFFIQISSHNDVQT